MANYFNLTIDTTAPKGVTLNINDGASKTSSTSVTLNIGCTDVGVGTQMKIWGEGINLTEATAQWQEFDTVYPVTFTVPTGATNPTMTFYLKVRDDVWNECNTVSASIQYVNSVPNVTIMSGPSRTKISKVEGMNTVNFEFSSDRPFSEYKICAVPNGNSLHSVGTVLLSGTTDGDAMEMSTTLTRNDEAGNPLNTLADGAHIIKIFVKDTDSNNWSV